MADPAADPPPSLQVFRYTAGAETVRAVIGEVEAGLPVEDLVAHAREALKSETFMCFAVSQSGDFVADELCFVPQGDRCEILNNLAAAVACGKLRILDETELRQEARAGTELLHFAIDDSASLTVAREAVDVILQESDIEELLRQRTILCISEAVTNMLLHGGGRGSMTLRRLHDRLRVVVADEGPGMNFLNWIGPPTKKGQASMGYGFKIILDYLDAVGLRTGQTGTTLLLDRKTN